ncbi:hypothetical protein ACLOJK_038680 [Asimina triloba]
MNVLLFGCMQLMKKTPVAGGAPTALVSLIGHKQYQRCAKDLYYFLQRAFSNVCPLQSTVCVKQLAYCMLELLYILD